MRRGSFGSRCGQQIGDLWHSCVKMCETVDLPFGVVSGVVPRNSVLDEVRVLHGEGEVFWEF